MVFNKKIINSRLGRRIFFMFIFCAMVPLITLTLLSFTSVTKQLNDQSHRRLMQSTKTYGMSLLERLMFLENNLRIVASDKARGITPQPEVDRLYEDINERFVGIYHFVDGQGFNSILGTIKNPPKLNSEQYAHILSGKPLLMTRLNSDTLSQIFLVQLVSKQDPNLGYIMGEVNPVPFWGIGHENKLPPLTELYALDKSNRMLISSLAVSTVVMSEKLKQASTHPGRELEFDFEGESYIASYWTVFLKPRYLLPNWTVILCQSESEVLAAAIEFKTLFPHVSILSLFTILLLSIIYIRKSMGPLNALKEGTIRIAKRDFSTPVEVQSKDEFKELATSFNFMSTQLNKQFKALTTRSGIDRAILSSLDKEKIIETLITRIKEFFSCDVTGFALMDPGSGKTSNYYLNRNDSAIKSVSGEVLPQDIEKFRNHPDYLQCKLDGVIPSYLKPVANNGANSFLVLPVFLNGTVAGVMHLGNKGESAFDSEDVKQARQFADQAAIALSNSSLVEALNEQNWGTLEALARSVDAKSPWTAGHSERVTKLALKIGAVLGLDSEQLELLHKGGLLHDVGKIGVPVTILDKPGKLTDEEFEVIKNHPPLGARILEPIKSFSEIIPFVVQHHERFDGQGYPDGIAGESISLGARILAIADAYDAMISDRPYRKGLPFNRIVSIIKEVSGAQFDPKVVQAFLKIVEHTIRKKTAKRAVNEQKAAIGLG